MLPRLIAALGLSAALLFSSSAAAADALDGAGPWPAIRKQRIRALLGPAMARAEVDAWLVLCRENDNDPLAAHVGGENAGGTAVIAFFRRGEAVESFALSPAGEATALGDVAVHDHVESFERPSEIPTRLAALLRERDPKRIAVNRRGWRSCAWATRGRPTRTPTSTPASTVGTRTPRTRSSSPAT